MRVLVTGHAGFIGAHMMRRLLAEGCFVLGADPRHDGSMQALEDFLSGALDVDAVIHLGAITDTQEEDVVALHEHNFELPCLLWKACTSRRIPMVYASSAAVYGRGERGFDEVLPTLFPLNKYGQSKLKFDSWVRNQEVVGSTPPRWAGLRFFNVYGPGEEHKGRMASMVSQAVWAEEQGVRLNLFQYGEQIRDFVYVGDVCEVIRWAALKMNPDKSGIFNVGSGVGSTFRTMASSVGCDHRWVPIPPELRRRFQIYTVANLRRLRAAGYARPFATLHEGLALYRTGT